MKRILFSILLVLLLTACAAPAAQTEPPVKATEPQLAATPTAEEAQLAPQSATAPEPTPLPGDINAPLIDSPSIINIEMLDEVYGWAVTEDYIIRTNDGGVTWYNVTPPSLTEAGYSVFTEFFDVSHAWVQVVDPNNYPIGGTLHRTFDGGITWESVETPFSAGEMEFVDANNGWMLADLGVGAGSMAVSIFQTTNGGADWDRVYTNDPNLENAGGTLPLGGLKILLTPLDMETAWVGGVIYAPGSVYLFRSDDAGETWFNINLILPESASVSELAIEKLHFVSDTQGVLVLRMTSQEPKTLIFLTDDGGNTWQPLPEPFPRASRLEIPSAQEIVFYTNDQFYVTKDAGQTFEVIVPDVKFGDSMNDMSFVNSSTGWVITANAANSNTLYKTTDGGQTWFAIIP
jgi:photosystem II stability/assembly factor-like uncharacterized protein